MSEISLRLHRLTKRGWQARPFLMLAASGLALTVLLTQVVRHIEQEWERTELEKRLERHTSAIHGALRHAEHDLSGLTKVFAVFGHVGWAEFEQLTKPILFRQPDIQHFSYHQVLGPQELPALEREMKQRFPDFTLSAIENGKLVPLQPQTKNRVITYLSPLEGNEHALGLVVSTREQQARAEQRACSTGRPVATPPYQLISQPPGQLGFVMLAPIYRSSGSGTQTGGAPCENVVGYMAAVYDVERFVNEAFLTRRLLIPSETSISVEAMTAEGQVARVFHREASAPSSSCWYCRLYPDPLPVSLSQEFEAAGLQWRVTLSRTSWASTLPIGSLVTLLAGVLISLLSAFYVHGLLQRSRRINRLVRQREADLRRAGEVLSQYLDLSNEFRKLSELFLQAPGFMAIVRGPEHVFEIANEAYYQLVGRRDIVGRSVKDALPELATQGILCLLDEVYATGEPFVAAALPLTLRNNEGEDRALLLDFVYQPIFGNDGRVTGIFAQGIDRSHEFQTQDRLQHLTTHDALTGLPNQTLLYDRLEQSILRSGQAQSLVVLCVIDMDGFKLINETLGRRAGDRALQEVAERLQGGLLEPVTIARLAGDKFALFYECLRCNLDPGWLPQQVIALMEAPIRAGECDLFLSCSIGIAVYPDDATAAETLLQAGELAMYNAKDNGRNNFQYFQPQMNEAVRGRLRIEADLRLALNRRELAVHYQPQVDLGTGQLVAVEALLRWNHPERGLLGAGDFIGLAEETGLIVPIGEWVMRSACVQACNWREAGLGDIRVAVNLSACQFHQSNLAQMISTLLDETGLPPHLLEIELTESLVMRDVDRAVDTLTALRALGLQLSVDDFGTGYSSLAYLKRFPIDVLKIDRSFVNEIPGNQNDAAIANAIISMAHSLGMRVIAEGVETESQCAFLANNLCDQIQGYLYARPLAADELEALVREKRSLPKHLLRPSKPARTLLLVDDEASILSALKRQLRGRGYEILTAASGSEGIEILGRHSVDVIVSDQRMPGMTGVEFLRTVKQMFPETVRIVLSGFTELQSVTDAVNEGAIYKFLTKPWEDDRLLEHIEEAFAHKEMANENRRLAQAVRAANLELARANKQLEDVLEQQQKEIQRGEISLDIVREALQNVPLAVLALDEDGTIVFMNAAAQQVLVNAGPVLGQSVQEVIPELMHAVGRTVDGTRFPVRVDGKWLQALSRNMGQGTGSRGTLITLLDADNSAK